MTTEPSIKVGIISAREIRFKLNGEYTFNGQTQAQEQHTVSATPTAMEWNGSLHHDILLLPKNANQETTFSLFDVTIGVDFHWERQETQTFRGALRLVCDGGKVCAINILPLEEYLKSVVSSEMSPKASLNFLKAHAVISRSWLLAQIRRKESGTIPSANTASPTYSPRREHDMKSILKWYDHEDHRLFDVCADDHCQRYQGITKISNPTADEAVRQTRGEVLTYAGEICDARFSKCCGGIMEEYASCWDDTQKPYLVAKPDIISDERTAGMEEAFCNTSDPAVLSQVLNDFDQETTDFYRWTVDYSSQQIDTLIKEKSGVDFGHIIALRPILRGPSGRIVLLEIQGTKTTMTVGKELEIRKWLSPSHLYSSAFEVEKLPNGFRLNGKGWGHGVGLCQIGAAVMGARGYNYLEILQHYYPGAKIKNTSAFTHDIS